MNVTIKELGSNNHSGSKVLRDDEWKTEVEFAESK